jgi:hypothetical protein
MELREYIKHQTLYLDGGMGTLLQAKGLCPGEHPEAWNLSHPDDIVAIHRDYFEAGANIVNANTFGANSLKFSDDELDAVAGGSDVSCACAMGGGGTKDANDKTCACVLAGVGYEKDGSERCLCGFAGYGYDS